MFAAEEHPSIIVVDIPIGLPTRSGPGGRLSEQAVRPLLGKLRSSVFSVPSRSAVYSEQGPFPDWQSCLAAHQRACEEARRTSYPPSGIALQAFMIFPEIREVDKILRESPHITNRIFETHPEVAFWRLNGRNPLTHGKRSVAEVAVRHELLSKSGMQEVAVKCAPPRGAKIDDVLDALACALIARRVHAEIAEPFPNPPQCDACGLPMAIWA